MVYQGSYDLRRDVDVLKRKVEDGVVDSESYFIQASTPVITYTTSFAPSSVTFRAYKTVNGFTDLFNCTLQIFGSNDGSTYTSTPIKKVENASSITHTVTTEYSYYKSKPDLQGILAGVKDIGANKCVLVVERLQENKQVSYMKMAEFQSTHKDLIDKYHLGDIHQNNVAYDMNNNIKIIDFGWVNMPSYN
jgi:hypothetical protein